MKRALSPARLDRWIERELLGGLPPRKRARLHEQLRQDPAARARYDRAVCALRVLEGDDELAPTELDVVGRWLADDWGEPASSEDAAGARRFWPAVVAALAAAMVLLWVGPARQLDDRWWEGRADGWQARGAASTGALAMEALCVADQPDLRGEPARARDCSRRDLMGFAYRAEQGIAGRITLFGIDADGDPMYYAPTPVDPEVPAIEAGRWRALPLAVRLAVNHAAGRLRIYALVSPSPARADEVEDWAAQLASQPAAGPGDEPWIERVDPEGLARVCPTLADCQAAELALTIAD